MKKLVATGTVAVLLLAASSPAFAQVTVDGDDNDSAQYVAAWQGQVALQAQFANADAEDDSEATAEVASDLGITQNQANGGFGEISDLNQGNDDVGDLFFED